jgi:hypothetical protein
VEDNTCLFCKEAESVTHVFFECCVAQSLWGIISEAIGLQMISDFESMGKLWLRKEF